MPSSGRKMKATLPETTSGQRLPRPSPSAELGEASGTGYSRVPTVAHSSQPTMARPLLYACFWMSLCLSLVSVQTTHHIFCTRVLSFAGLFARDIPSLIALDLASPKVIARPARCPSPVLFPPCPCRSQEHHSCSTRSSLLQLLTQIPCLSPSHGELFHSNHSMVRSLRSSPGARKPPVGSALPAPTIIPSFQN